MTENEEFGKRLLGVIKELKYNVSSFNRKLEGGNVNLYSVIKGERSPRIAFLNQINDAFPEISIEYLVTGRGTPLFSLAYAENTEAVLMESQAEYLNDREQLNFKKLYLDSLSIINSQKNTIEGLSRSINSLSQGLK